MSVMTDDGFSEVTPNLERMIVKRTYKRYGKTIKVFKVLSCTGVDYKVTLADAPLFEFEMPTEDSAKLLMEDLYYGEYTGA